MDNRVQDVPLRKRATPYDFAVMIASGGKHAGIYKGRAYKEAVHSYWEAVHLLEFLGQSGEVKMGLTLDRKPFGCFTTEVEQGRRMSVHKPSGVCKEWVTRGWTGHPIEEKLIATIPGTLGLPRDPES
jgi:hypothetical protein